MWSPWRWRAGQLGVQVGQVAFQHDPVDVGERGDADAVAEPGEPGQGDAVRGGRPRTRARCPAASAATV